MKPRTFYAFAAATAVVAVAAIVAVATQPGTTRVASGGERAFPALSNALNDASEIAVKSNAAAFTIKKNGDAWVIVEKDNYPVEFDKVKSALVKLSDLRLLESKTSDPTRYERLQLNDVSEKDAKSKEITVKDGKGQVVASGVLGRRNSSLFGATASGTYMRRTGQAQAWLAEGDVDIGATPNDWLQRRIVEIPSERVKSAEIAQPTGEKLVLHKDKPDDKNYTVDNIPAGRKLGSEGEANGIGGGLWRLELEDVKQADKVPFEKPWVAIFQTFDGVTVRLESVMVDKDVWTRVAATADDPQGDDAAKEKLKAEAAAITERNKGWAYKMSPGDGERLTRKLDDLLEKPEAGKS
ncbi:MAG TPA: DUF4340 domain-containing protein [Alphaproteobacteria bacterium]